jgi:2-polyprenyl-6-hydroxyphenyl methylase / 3-demethylubiquinone-9 3-methyltransferase
MMKAGFSIASSMPDLADQMASATIKPDEAAHFGALAEDWWNPKGSSAMLHKLNPVRLGFVRAMINGHWIKSSADRFPLAGKSLLDVGCGGGLMTEALARMGGKVTGVDAAPENISVAQAHADAQGLDVHYVCADVATMDGQFDLVTSMEVVEHVEDPAAFIQALADRLAPGGLMVLSTPNRTPLSRLALITVGEGLGQIPKGTHDWSAFLTPEELETFCVEAGLRVTDKQGLSFNPTKGFVLSQDMMLNYLFAVERT